MVLPVRAFVSAIALYAGIEVLSHQVLTDLKVPLLQKLALATELDQLSAIGATRKVIESRDWPAGWGNRYTQWRYRRRRRSSGLSRLCAVSSDKRSNTNAAVHVLPVFI
jgi:hypothetical protein